LNVISVPCPGSRRPFRRSAGGCRVVHACKPLESSAAPWRRRMTLAPPAGRAREPRQASRGGRVGSAGSGRTLLAVRLEGRRAGDEVGEGDRAQDDPVLDRGRGARQRDRRARRRTHVAPVLSRFTVPGMLAAGIFVRAVIRLGMSVGRRRRVVPDRVMLRCRLARLVAQLDRAGLPCRCAKHRRRERPANGKQQDEKEDEPEAKRLHGDERSRADRFSRRCGRADQSAGRSCGPGRVRRRPARSGRACR